MAMMGFASECLTVTKRRNPRCICQCARTYTAAYGRMYSLLGSSGEEAKGNNWARAAIGAEELM